MIGAHFRCNICGAPSAFEPEGDWRESATCTGCGSSVRLRGIIHVLTARLFGESIPLKTAPVRRDLSGVGLSDWEGYASILRNKFDYVNSFYHQEPHLDIMAPESEWIGSRDFMISSDVFEHVSHPVADAFHNAARILKPGGVLVLTAPYGDDPSTKEHYPGARDIATAKLGDEYIAIVRSADGRVTVDQTPVFHGGPGTTLEMRVFSLPDILDMLEKAGFGDIFVHSDPDPRWGVFPPHRYGLPITARRVR